MALTTDIAHPRYARWRCAMVAVAIVAGWGRQVAFIYHHPPVHAFLVIRQLVGGNFVRRHVLGVGVTRPACVSNMQRMNGGARVTGRFYGMRLVTIGAGGNLGILLFF